MRWQWLDIVEAASVEERHRAATERTTACLSELKAVQQLHDAHPVVAALVQAVEERDITVYSQAYEIVQGVGAWREDELRAQVETALRVAVPGLTECVTANLADKAWGNRLGEWEAAWRWAVVENWLRKRSDVGYRERLWQLRKETDSAISTLLGEAAALRAWTYFFNRPPTPSCCSEELARSRPVNRQRYGPIRPDRTASTGSAEVYGPMSRGNSDLDYAAIPCS